MKLINPGHLMADDFEIDRLNRSFVFYKQGEKSLKIEVEPGFIPTYYLAVFLSSSVMLIMN